MNRKTIAILFGGCSDEYEVSLQSAYAVTEHFNEEKYQMILLGITRQGEWKLYQGERERIAAGTWQERAEDCLPAILSPDRSVGGILVLEEGRNRVLPVDAVFPVLHGKNGEDGTVQGLLALAGIPCVGCGILSSALCMDKDIAHKLVTLAGVKTPQSIVLHGVTEEEGLREQTAHLTYPLFVKPVNAGSSFGISKVAAPEDLRDSVIYAFRYDHKVIIEEAVDGFEVGCAVLGNEALVIGELDEIALTQGFFDYTEKYTLNTSQIHMPARVAPEAAKRLKETAALIYQTLNCAGFARVDMFLTPEGEIIFNEVNTIPGFTAHSRYPNMLKGIGMSFGEILDRLIGLAVES